MKNYDVIIFDLDGTLIDTGIGVINSTTYALNKFNIEVTDKKELYKFMGPPLEDSFKDFFGFSPQKAKVAVEYYRDYYKDKGIFESSVYDGMEKLLSDLKRNGKIIILATSKTEVFAKQILDHLGLAKYFSFIAGSCLDGTRSAKDELITYALEKCGIADKTKAVMIGDRKYDVIGAKKAGIDCIGVLFGYGSREELQNVGADYIAQTVSSIGKIILGK